MGSQKTNYPIQKKSGFYFLLEFQAEGDAINKFEVELKRDERVMRFLTMKMDKHHVEYAKKNKAQ